MSKELVEGFVTMVCNQCNDVQREYGDCCRVYLSKDRREAKFNEVKQ